MANSTTRLDLIVTGQAQKEVTANALFNAMSPTALFGIKSAVGLSWVVYGGAFAGAALANQSLTLTASATLYLEATADTGAVSFNNTGFTAGRIKLYTVTTDSAGATDIGLSKQVGEISLTVSV